MSGVVVELQKKLVDSNLKLSQILHFAYLIARELEQHSFADWLKREMEGYEKESICPDYRKVKGLLKGCFSGNIWKQIPILNLDHEEAYSTFKETSSILELERHIECGKEMGHVYPSALTQRLKVNCTQPTIYYLPEVYESMLVTVRNILIDWTVQLKKKGIKGENMEFLKEDVKKAKDTAPTSVTYNIGAVHGGMQTAHNNDTVNQTQNNQKSSGFLSMLWNGLKKIFTWWKK